MNKLPELEKYLSGLPASRSTADPWERHLYSRDLAVVPLVIERLLFKTTPDLLVRPQTVEEVAGVLSYASVHRIPVTPRASASTALYNAVPTKGGILLDLNALRGIVAVNLDRETVTVLAATRLKELDDRLRYQYGWATKTYPTSAPSATVGGWFNTGGWGVGGLKYGCMHALVLRAEAVLSSGQIVELTPDSNPPLSWFAGSEGTLGVVTRLELSIRPAPRASSHHLLAFQNLLPLQEMALALASSSPKLYHLHFHDDVFVQVAKQAGFNLGLPLGVHLLSVHYEGEVDEVQRGVASLATLLKSHGVRELDADLAEEQWRGRFSEVRLKRAGPTLLGAEVWLPLSHLADFVRAARTLGEKTGTAIYTYGAIVSDRDCQINAFFPTDERRSLPYLSALSLTKRLHDLSARLGGRPYGIGAWNTPYLSTIFSKGELAERRRRKRYLDPHGIMNPGKVYRSPFLLARPFFSLGMAMLGLGLGGVSIRR